jgi:hypothetical protein
VAGIHEMNFDVVDLGLIEYKAAWKLQEPYPMEVADGQQQPTPLLLEHSHVYTFGRRGSRKIYCGVNSVIRLKATSESGVSSYGSKTITCYLSTVSKFQISSNIFRIAAFCIGQRKVGQFYYIHHCWHCKCRTAILRQL